MSGLALVMSGMGYSVSGSDRNPSDVGIRLGKLGVRVFTGHDAANISGAEFVVASAAIPEDNPEMMAARAAGITVISRAEMLGILMREKRGIAVSGTHGKTSTTSMLALMLERAALDPTILIGGVLRQIGGNAKMGSGDLFVAEACEAFGSFLELEPSVAIVTNIDADHLDCYGSLDAIKASFVRFLSQVRDGGFAVMCTDCPNVMSVLDAVKPRVVSYGLDGAADCVAHTVDVSGRTACFRASYRGSELGTFRLGVPGIHNVRNALAAIAVGCELGLDVEITRAALAEFTGAGRRFEVLGTENGITVIDDYAHHPAEVQATLTAARGWGRRVVAVFQPHLFSRTQLFAGQFAASLAEADMVFVTGIYAARELPIQGVTSSLVTDVLETARPGICRLVSERGDLVDQLLPALRDGDIVVMMGAGDIWKSGRELLDRLRGV